MTELNVTDPPENDAPGPRVLIVEDDPDQRELICEAIAMHFEDRPGLKIVGVGTGEEALRQDLAGFDVVFLDYWLPDTDGLTLLEKMLAVRDLPVIFVTGESCAAIAAEAIRRGAQDYVVKLGDYLFALPIVLEKNIRQYQLKRENTRLQAQIKASLEEVRVKNLQLEESLRLQETMAATDHLTGLANRRAFAEMLDHYFSQATRYNFDLTCAMCDLDHYKILNDTLGHQLGDKVLITAAEVIRANLRTSDGAARYGGDEFVLLLPHTSVEMGLNVADRIRQQIVPATRSYIRAGRGVTMSFGIASLQSDGPSSADALVSMADKALYIAKDRGKDCIVTFGEIGLLSR